MSRTSSRTMAIAAAFAIVAASTTAALASCQVTTAIRASDATLTPSRNAPATADFRSRGSSGTLAATKAKAGRKMPRVATAAPAGPSSR